MMLYSSKIAAAVKNSQDLQVNLKKEEDDRAVYMIASTPGRALVEHRIEEVIDLKYLDGREDPFRVESYLSSGNVAENIQNRIRCHFVNKCSYAEPNPTGEDIFDLDKVADSVYLKQVGQISKMAHALIVRRALEEIGPVIETDTATSNDCIKLMVAYRRKTTETFYTSITDLYHHHGFYSEKKFMENFSNGVTLFVAYLKPIEGIKMSQAVLSQITKEVSLLYIIPNSPFHRMFQEGKLTAQEMLYAHSVFIYCQHFINRLGKEYWHIKELLNVEEASHQQMLEKLKRRLRTETFTSEYIKDIIKRYPELLKYLYVNFAVSHYVTNKRESVFSVAFVSDKKEMMLDDLELADKIKATVTNDHEALVFEAFLKFNDCCIKTNFYKPSKLALSFKLNPDVLSAEEYPLKPFGMFLVIGNEFRGFHIRFQDIARGGIRIIRSRNVELYNINKRSLFDENYALASTQNRKNKDIPEGGSKGTILLDPKHQNSAKIAFEKYIDALLDLISTGGKDGRRTRKKSEEPPEILFFGPDEGTADFMDWAALHAKKRGLHYWKAITTGKSQSLGGIPHDTYGMTTRSVHQYVLGIFEKLGIDESKVTKLQTGGPDGDLGSNEIKISKDKTIAVVDGSGVLYDPAGIDREELGRLADERKMICNFDPAKLGEGGFKVLVEDCDIVLPDGTKVTSGLNFRNTFHLNPLSSADLFVPCGGRPESVDINNYHLLLNADGSPRFKYIVEGANLFFTQNARIALEKAGCIIFKDASANKGGVTSSSLEVLAALSLDDEDFSKNMTVQDGSIPKFYQDYVAEVHKILETNAKAEFECIWKESLANPAKTKSELSDMLSLAILELKTQLQADQTLWNDNRLRERVFAKAIPELLQEKAGGLPVLMERLPENYLKAIFSSSLASHFIYSSGIRPRKLGFFAFVARILLEEE